MTPATSPKSNTHKSYFPFIAPTCCHCAFIAHQDKEASPSTDSSQQQQPSEQSSSTTTTADSSNPTIAGADSQQLQVSKEVIETLRNKVFGEHCLQRQQKSLETMI